jgi:hypothetical protein
MFEREQKRVLKKFENEENDEAVSNCRQDMCTMEKRTTSHDIQTWQQKGGGC